MKTSKTSNFRISKVSLTNAAALLMASTLVGQVLGFLRTKLVNANFPILGAHSTDAYFAAFNVPDFFYFTLSAGALGVALIPVLAERYSKSGAKKVWEIANSLMNLMAIVMLVIGIVIFFSASWLIHHVVAPGLSPAQANTAATIMRFLAFNPFIFTVSGILASVQQTFGRFFFFAVAPLSYNLSIIVSIFIFKDNIGLVGLGLGALIGALLQLFIISLGVKNSKFHWSPKITWKSKDFHTVLINLPPRSLDQGMDQVEDIVETHLASNLGSGTITNFNNAYILSTAPIMLIGTAISTAIFPRLTHRLGQNRPDLFRKDFLSTIRIMIWLAAPVTVIGYFCRGYLARMIYTQGNSQISNIFGFMIGAIFFGILYAIISRWFYAHKDTRTPLIVSIFTIALNVILAYSLSRPSAYGADGLALAQSIVAGAEVLVLVIIMVIRDHKLFDWHFISGLIRIASVTGFSVVAGFVMVSIYPLEINERGIFVLGGRVALITLVTFAVHFGISSFFGLEEVRPVLTKIKNLISRPIHIEV